MTSRDRIRNVSSGSLFARFAMTALFAVACGGDGSTPTTPAPAPPPAPQPAPEPPAVPTGLTIADSGAGFIEWAWDAVEGVSGYDVQFTTNRAFTDEAEIIPRTAEQTSYRREDLMAGSSGYLRVRSAAGTGDERVTSDWSASVGTIAPPLVVGAWSASGTGSRLLDLPTRIELIRITGEYDGASEHFAVWCGSDRSGLIVDELMGTVWDQTRFSGIFSARREYNDAGEPCRQLDIESSESGVGREGTRWTITEVSEPRGSLTPTAGTGSEFGDRQAVERARIRRQMAATRR